jgi:hypothetical protein
VILPPQTGDEGIHTQAPDPHAGHEEEVIPPPGVALPDHRDAGMVAYSGNRQTTPRCPAPP